AMGCCASQVSQAATSYAQPPAYLTDHPRISVVVPSVTGLSVVAECLECLIRQEGAAAAEILVVDRCGEPTRADLRGQFPQVRVIAVEGRPSIPALRAMGIEHARGQIVALLEDHCLVQPGWLRAIEKAFDAGCQAV